MVATVVRRSARTLRAALLLAVFVVGANGHARFVCPMPNNGNSGNKLGPCGSGDSGQFTVVAPGPLTVRFEETVYHKGAPTAFRLFKRGNTANSCLLLDHMPHADNWPPGLNCGLGPIAFSRFPVGVCKNTTAYVTINIPDLDCDDCVLQMVSVMTDKIGENQTCTEANLSVNCSTYYSCANLRILGRSKDLSICSRYEDNVVGAWPFKQRPPGVYGKYEGSLDDFTPEGWMRALQMAWLEVGFAPMTMAEGSCAPPSKRYVAIFDDDGGGLSGVFSLVLNGEYNVFVSGLLSEQISGAWLEASVLTPFLPNFVHNNTLLAITTVLYNRSSEFISKLGLLLHNGSRVTANFVPAVWTASLRQGSDYYGEVVYAADGRRVVAVNNLNGTAAVRSLTINGPGKVPSPTVLERFDADLRQRGAVLISSSKWGAMSGSQPLPSRTGAYSSMPYLWTDRAHVRLELSKNSSSGRSTNVSVTARLPRPRPCDGTSSLCFGDTFPLIASDSSLQTGGPNVTRSGVGALSINGSSYGFTLLLENIRDNETATRVWFQGNEVNFQNIPVMTGDDVLVVAGTIPWKIADKTPIDVLLETTAGTYKASINGIQTTTSASLKTTTGANRDTTTANPPNNAVFATTLSLNSSVLSALSCTVLIFIKYCL